MPENSIRFASVDSSSRSGSDIDENEGLVTDTQEQASSSSTCASHLNSAAAWAHRLWTHLSTLDTAYPDSVLPPTTLTNKRLILRYLSYISLLQELSYLFFQQQESTQGLIELGNPNVPSDTLGGWVLSGADLGANLTSINPAADADGIAFKKRSNFERIQTISNIIDYASYASYAVGATGSAIPVLQALTKLSAPAAQGLTPLVTAFFLFPGSVYYTLFNINNLERSFSALNDLVNDPHKPFERIKNNPAHFIRYCEVLLRAIAVVGFRAINFAFLAQDLAPLLLTPYGFSKDTIHTIGLAAAGITCLTTAANVTFTRVIRPFDKLAHVNFDYVSEAEYKAASKAKPALLESLVAYGSAALTAAGYGIMAHSLMSQHEWQAKWENLTVGSLVFALSLAKSVYVEHTAAIYNRALATLDKSELNRRKGITAVADTANDPEMLGFKQATGEFEELSDKMSTPQLEACIAICDFLARTARTLSFYAFVTVLTEALKPFGITFSNEQKLALCLILAPENFKNDFLVFQIGMREMITGYFAKVELEKHQTGRDLTYWETANVYFRSPFDYPASTITQVLRSMTPDVEQRLLTANNPLLGNDNRPVSERSNASFTFS